MTRPKADTDPWLTDPLSRDRVIAKTVVEGMADIIKLLRGIRSDLDESKGLRGTVERLERDLSETRIALGAKGYPMPLAASHLSYEKCSVELCILPSGHNGGHQPTRKR